MRRLFLASIAGLFLAGCTIVVPLEDTAWTPAGPRRYVLRRGTLQAEVYHAGPIAGWAWRVVDPRTGAIVDAERGRGAATVERAKERAEAALARAQGG